MILTPMKCIAARKKVTTNELVTVNEYGSKPIRLQSKIVIKR
jgi:hypothetical protein